MAVQSGMIDAVTTAHHALDTTMNVASIVLNVFLLYLIRRHSTFGVPLYKTLLTVDATLDLLLACVALNAQPLALTANNYFVLVSNGFFSGRSREFDAWSLTAMDIMLLANVLWIPLQFAYRMQLLQTQKGKLKTCGVALFVAVLAIFGMTTGAIAFYFFFHPPLGPDPGSTDVFLQNGWSHKQAERHIIFGGRVDLWNLTAWTAVWTGACVGSIVLVVVFESKMFAYFRRLKDSAQNISENTRKMHRDFHRTLLAMAICPLFTTTAPLLYFSVTTFLAVPPGPISAFVEMAVTSITVFNPLTTICFMRCYRSAALRILRCRRDAADANAVQLFHTDSLPT